MMIIIFNNINNYHVCSFIYCIYAVYWLDPKLIGDPHAYPELIQQLQVIVSNDAFKNYYHHIQATLRENFHQIRLNLEAIYHKNLEQLYPFDLTLPKHLPPCDLTNTLNVESKHAKSAINTCLQTFLQNATNISVKKVKFMLQSGIELKDD